MLRVVTLNIGGLEKFPNDPYPVYDKARAAQLAKYCSDADIVLVQEASDVKWPWYSQVDTFALLQKHAKHSYRASARTAKSVMHSNILRLYQQTGVLSKYPFSQVWRYAGTDPALHRLVHVRVDTPDGPVDVMPVHFPLDDPGQVAQAQFIRGKIGAIPRGKRLIIGGDFNAGPGRPGFDRLFDGTALKETFDPARDQYCPGDDHIDHILTRGFSTTSYGCSPGPYKDRATDHPAVTVALEPAPVEDEEPAECPNLRGQIASINRQSAVLNARWKQLIATKPIDWEAVGEVKAGLAELNGRRTVLVRRSAELGCLPMPLAVSDSEASEAVATPAPV